MISWLIYAVLGLLVLFGIIALIFVRRKQKVPTDYYNLFVIGVIWVAAGVPLGVTNNNWTLSVMGFIFILIGIVHRKEWKKNIAERKKRWGNLNSKERKFFIWVKWILLLILAAGILAFILFSGLI